MLTRNSPESISDNPLLDSPYNQISDFGLGHYPFDDHWLLLDGEHFSQLEGSDWAFLGTF